MTSYKYCQLYPWTSTHGGASGIGFISAAMKAMQVDSNATMSICAVTGGPDDDFLGPMLFSSAAFSAMDAAMAGPGLGAALEEVQQKLKQDGWEITSDGHYYRKNISELESMLTKQLPKSVTPQAETVNISTLESMQQKAQKVVFIFKAGSVLSKTLGMVNYILDNLKSVGFGLGYKAVTKVLPQIKLLDDSLKNLQTILERVSIPTDTLCKFLPPVIKGIQAREVGQVVAAEFSGQLGKVVTLMPALHGDLTNLNGLIQNTGNVVGVVANGSEKLKSLPKMETVANSLKEALLKLQTVLVEAGQSLQELIGTFDQTLTWLPTYHTQARQLVTGDKTCQAVTKSSFFSKSYCQQPIQWFDDQAPAKCSQCGLQVCEAHRVEVAAPLDKAIRNSWLCQSCASKK